MESKIKKYLPLAICLFLVFAACSCLSSIGAFISLLVDAAFPFLLGAAIAYAVNILMTFYERHYFTKQKNSLLVKSRRPICMIGAYISIFIVLIAVVWIIVPQLFSCIQTLIERAPEAVAQLLSAPIIAENLPQDLTTSMSNIDWQAQIPHIVELLKSGVVGIIGNVSSVFSSIISWVIGIIFSFYLLWGKEKLASQCQRLMSCYFQPKWRERALRGATRLNTSFHKYIVGQCVEAIILGVLCTLGMLLFRFPYAAMIGTLVGVCALIPIVGAYIGAFVGAFMILSVSPIKAILFLIFLIILQQLEGNLIYPRVVGASIGLPGIWVLFAVTVFGALFGVAGMLLGVPITAAMYGAIGSNVRKREEAEKNGTN